MAAIIERGGEWFVARRKPEKKMGGLWEFPGGKLEPSDPSPEAGLQRELREELCIETHIGEALASTDFTYDGQIYRVVAYRATHLSGEIVLTDHDAMAWVLPANLWHYDLTPADRDLLRKLGIAA